MAAVRDRLSRKLGAVRNANHSVHGAEAAGAELLPHEVALLKALVRHG